VIVNRVLPALSVDTERALEINAAHPCGPSQALADHAAAAAGDDERIQELLSSAPGATVARVPLLPSDVHDVDTLRRIAELLTER
jgi:hypothetical protein